MSRARLLALAAPALAVACARGESDAARAPGDVRPAAAPPARFGVGRLATRAEVAAWDRDVDTTGRGLPAGSGGYDAGARVYAARCAACHGARGEGQGAFPRLVQAPTLDSVTRDSFPFVRDAKLPKTVGNYWPYATTLYDYVRHAMPYDRPGSLTPDEVYAVVAYLLAENGVVARTAVMDARTLPRVAMPARRHFVPDDRKGGPELR
jgi:cytochrome c